MTSVKSNLDLSIVSGSPACRGPWVHAQLLQGDNAAWLEHAAVAPAGLLADGLQAPALHIPACGRQGLEHE